MEEEEKKRISGVSSYKKNHSQEERPTLIDTSKSNNLLKALSPDLLMLGVRFQICTWGEQIYLFLFV
jgi:hypothetical protein